MSPAYLQLLQQEAGGHGPMHPHALVQRPTKRRPRHSDLRLKRRTCPAKHMTCPLRTSVCTYVYRYNY